MIAVPKNGRSSMAYLCLLSVMVYLCFTEFEKNILKL